MTKSTLLNNSLRKNLTASFLGIFFALIILEICCQIYSIFLYKQWETIKSAPDHYFKASHNVFLGYELESNYKIEKENRRLLTNRFGIRDLEHEISAMPKIAILGDSVVFGNVLSQEQTISSLFQESISRTGAEIKVLNFGVPGYAFRELVEFLKIKDKIYGVDHVIYILNPNDFTRRNSIYEGADAGLYRMYNQPLVKSPWFIRKFIYRINKYNQFDDYRKDKASVRWYQWLFEGNRDTGYKQIEEMASYVDQKGSSFTVVLLPAGVAYGDNGSYELSGMYEEIGVFLEENSINYINPTDTFMQNVEGYFDPTDHLTFEGNALMVEILRRYLQQRDKEIISSVRR